MSKVYTYEFFQEYSTKTSRLRNRLPNDTLKIMGNIKEKLNIKDKSLFIRPVGTVVLVVSFFHSESICLIVFFASMMHH